VTRAEINLIVLRATQRQSTQGFYEALGLSFLDEQHDRGPAHVSATTRSGIVVELYPLPSGEEVENGTRGVRLGFVVADVDTVIQAVLRAGGSVMSKDDQGAVLEDPDGRKVQVTARADEP